MGSGGRAIYDDARPRRLHGRAAAPVQPQLDQLLDECRRRWILERGCNLLNQQVDELIASAVERDADPSQGDRFTQPCGEPLGQTGRVELRLADPGLQHGEEGPARTILVPGQRGPGPREELVAPALDEARIQVGDRGAGILGLARFVERPCVSSPRPMVVDHQVIDRPLEKVAKPSLARIGVAEISAENSHGEFL